MRLRDPNPNPNPGNPYPTNPSTNPNPNLFGTVIVAADKPFVQRRSLAAFISLFLHNNDQINANRKARFEKYLSSTEDLFVRPSTRPTWRAHMTHHQPMFGVLQGKYDDVEFELKTLRRIHNLDQILFVGGDGLSIMRVNWLISRDPIEYLEERPIIVPVQGEAPHGVFHILHAGWRLYIRFLRACALHLTNQNPKGGINAQVRDEPTVSDLNNSLHFMNRVTKAACEYLTHLVRHGGPAIDDPDNWLNAANANIDLAWVVHYLYDFAFLLLDFKNAVRAGDSKHLDLLWREFILIGHAKTANKTNYCPMAIMTIFRSFAMDPQLLQLYENIRSIPMSTREGSKVGWDMPCEWLNLAITQGVKYGLSEERISKFVAGFALSDASNQLLREQFLDRNQLRATKMKSIDADSLKIKSFFMDKIGRDWATASRRNQESRLGITRGKKPWDEVREAATAGGKDSIAEFVKETVRRYTLSFYTWG